MTTGKIPTSYEYVIRLRAVTTDDRISPDDVLTAITEEVEALEIWVGDDQHDEESMYALTVVAEP
jgi:hypothetical protein